VARTARKPGKRKGEKWSSSGGVKFLPPDEMLTLTIYLRHRQPVRRRPGSTLDLVELTKRITLEGLEAERKRILKRPIEQVRRFAEREHMRLLAVDLRSRCVTLVVKASDAERVFATKLLRFDDEGVQRHYPRGKLRMPPQLADIAHTVLGLDTRPPRGELLRNHAGTTNNDSLQPSQIARLYGMATAGRGAGQCIAIIAPAGGYHREDVTKSCQAMQVPMPQITDINVGSGHNAPGVNARADEEVALDIQVVAGIAPEARIVIYFTELSEPGLVAGLCAAVHGPHRPNVIVMTWGEPEVFWPKEARVGLDVVLQDAVRLGITVVATAGDDLARERMSGGKVYVNYPASSPYVLGCGGTQIKLDPQRTAIVDEVVWNEQGRRGTGGGISEIYAVPAFQSETRLPGSLNDGKPGRGDPDIAAAAGQLNGYRIFLGGTEVVVSGTSAVAPLWGAFIALLNEQRGLSLGFLNGRLYQSPHLLKAITSGDNIDTDSDLGYKAGEGWSACTGLGSPNGPAIIATLTALA
jgi:kumamolisin